MSYADKVWAKKADALEFEQVNLVQVGRREVARRLDCSHCTADRCHDHQRA